MNKNIVSSITIFLVVAFATACSSVFKCGAPDGARVVYIQKGSCRIRIKQVTIGSELKIPESLKGSSLAGMEPQWVEPMVLNGQIISGHYVIAPQSINELRRP